MNDNVCWLFDVFLRQTTRLRNRNGVNMADASVSIGVCCLYVYFFRSRLKSWRLCLLCAVSVSVLTMLTPNVRPLHLNGIWLLARNSNSVAVRAVVLVSVGGTNFSQYDNKWNNHDTTTTDAVGTNRTLYMCSRNKYCTCNRSLLSQSTTRISISFFSSVLLRSLLLLMRIQLK